MSNPGRSLLCLVLVLFACAAPAVRAADVTLSTVTLHKDYSLVLGVTAYFQCKGDAAEKTLPSVSDVGVTYNFTGQETWQPVFSLAPGECRKCGVYQKKFLVMGLTIGEWTTCYDNFTVASPASAAGPELAAQPGAGFFTYDSPSDATVVLTCPDCTAQGGGGSGSPPSSSGSTSPPSTATATTTPNPLPSSYTAWMSDAKPASDQGSYDVSKYIWIGAVLLVVGVVLFVSVIVFYFWRRARKAQSEASVYREYALKSAEAQGAGGAAAGGAGESAPLGGESRPQQGAGMV
eukprot:TRINITY_DN5293_c0_g1_i1.p1 TRINITY_DN5293_c0_g1~~TRINITY_DN5293_c0_g1_i1.p1  ORF type:complete len:291 (-),score=-6.94 TRINITY_DN5293_c0_g1_i1:587-1459(-)